MLVTLQSVVRKAQRGKYAVGAFNVSDLEQTQAVIQAARKLRSPVIVNTSEKAIAYAGLEELVALVITMAKKYPIPVVLNLDHGRNVKLAKGCIAVGYTGIMFDGSHLPPGRNIQQTNKVVAAGRKRGIGVEGELTRVKYLHEMKKDPTITLTDPAKARDFVRRTGVIAFAPAIGNSHGLPIPHERLYFDRLKEIQKQVSVPLVLHGASGTPPASMRKAIQLGICKVNIDTDLRLSFSRALRSTLKENRKVFDPRKYLSVARDEMMKVVEKDIVLFGSRNKAR